jgi:hypothetical protein
MHVHEDRTHCEERTPLAVGGHRFTDKELFIDQGLGFDLRVGKRCRRAMAKSVVHVYRKCV